MMRRSMLTVLCTVLMLVGCSTTRQAADPTGSAESAAPSPTSVPTMLILDGSGSMTEADAPGPRIDAAKNAANGLIEALPDGAEVGLETYGTTTGTAETDKPAGCQDVTVLMSPRPLDRTAMRAAIAGITPSGYTPISLALRAAADQLPADASPQAIVLVSDGEDTCDTPPCDTAAELKRSHPGLTVSTVGFKLDGPAADQLRCIAETTGGIFVHAANADQLAARLLATQNIGQANKSLSATGIFGIDLGTGIADIRAEHPDFPDAGTTGEVTVRWIDCDFDFRDGVLQAIRPRNGGRTIDGLTSGSPVAEAAKLYGKPLAAAPNSDGTTTVTFDADPGTDAAYRIVVEGYADTGSTVEGTVTSIVLCLCKPRAATTPGPERIVLAPVDAQGNPKPGFREVEINNDSPIDCSFGSPSPYDVTHGVRFCGGTADSGDACWPTSGGAYVLCLTDPFSTELVRRIADGATSPLEPAEGPPRPMAIELEDGTTCRARIGGAWDIQEVHPDYVGQFGCNGGSVPGTYVAVWGPADENHGIVESPDGWIVEVGDNTGPLTPLRVTKAYYVAIS
ncbi:vWA domain-containing protein [Mycolicibacterium sp.]|uniref:vWA domain-containing protein n=1 Tax=Mycolicibacterium sp. TaxID=2320850 RepID=UPI003D147DC0